MHTTDQVLAKARARIQTLERQAKDKASALADRAVLVRDHQVHLQAQRRQFEAQIEDLQRQHEVIATLLLPAFMSLLCVSGLFDTWQTSLETCAQLIAFIRPSYHRCRCMSCRGVMSKSSLKFGSNCRRTCRRLWRMSWAISSSRLRKS